MTKQVSEINDSDHRGSVSRVTISSGNHYWPFDYKTDADTAPIINSGGGH